jgi:hypothetical protein
MSLKAFHVAFITLSSTLAFGFAAWEWTRYGASGSILDLAIGVLSTVAGLSLIAYGVRFLRKFRHVSFI